VDNTIVVPYRWAERQWMESETISNNTAFVQSVYDAGVVEPFSVAGGFTSWIKAIVSGFMDVMYRLWSWLQSLVIVPGRFYLLVLSISHAPWQDNVRLLVVYLVVGSACCVVICGIAILRGAVRYSGIVCVVWMWVQFWLNVWMFIFQTIYHVCCFVVKWVTLYPILHRIFVYVEHQCCRARDPKLKRNAKQCKLDAVCAWLTRCTANCQHLRFVHGQQSRCGYMMESCRGSLYCIAVVDDSGIYAIDASQTREVLTLLDHCIRLHGRPFGCAMTRDPTCPVKGHFKPRTANVGICLNVKAPTRSVKYPGLRQVASF